MPRDFSRTSRIAEQIRRDLSELIQLEVRDPRASGVTLTDVEVSPDYCHAKVYFTALGSEAQVAVAASGLRHAAGFLRSQLARRIKLRVVPELHFVHDTSVERGIRLSNLIDAAVRDLPAKDAADN